VFERAVDEPARRTTLTGTNFAPAMAAGILSIAAGQNDQPLLSDVLLLCALGAVGLTVWRILREIAGRRTKRPDWIVTGLTWVAACGALGARLGPANPAFLFAFGALALAGLGAMTPILVLALQRRIRRQHSWSINPSWLLGPVAVQSTTILAGSTGTAVSGSGVAIWSTVLWFVGLITYAVVIVLILRRIHRNEVNLRGLTPDYWIAMGALAISTVAATHVRGAAARAPALLAAAAAWLPYLLVMELLRARHLGVRLEYDPLRWSTVFPLAMFSVAAHDVGLPGLALVGNLFWWAALAVAFLNLAAAARARLVRVVPSSL
jgi:tellurite resistance protein TehA-like permease